MRSKIKIGSRRNLAGKVAAWNRPRFLSLGASMELALLHGAGPPHVAFTIELSLSSPLSGRKIVTASAKLFLPN